MNCTTYHRPYILLIGESRSGPSELLCCKMESKHEAFFNWSGGVEIASATSGKDGETVEEERDRMKEKVEMICVTSESEL